MGPQNSKLKGLSMLWTDYRYRVEDYIPLINSLRNVSKHKYGILLKEEPGIKGYPGGPRVFKVPEGWVILNRKPETRHYRLQDLEEKPLKLVPFIILWDKDKGRLRLQINRDYVRLQLKRAKALSSKAHWYGGRRKNERDYIKAINNLTRELRAIAKVAYVYPETRRAYNTKLRGIVLTFMTSVLGLKKSVALRKIEKYLTTF